MAPNNDIHSKVVKEWEKKAAKGLNSDQQVQLLEKAIHIIQQRACETLSSVSLMVILDRILHEGREKFPILSEASIDSHILNLKKIHQNKNYKEDEALGALRFVLIELLKVLGRITANILTAPLHNELQKVTWSKSEKT